MWKGNTHDCFGHGSKETIWRITEPCFLTNEEIIIERAGKKVAKLTGIGNSPTQKNREGELGFQKAEGLGAELWEKIDIDEYIKKEHEGWD